MPHITIGSAEARDRLAHVLNKVAYGGQRYIVERRGRPLAAIIPAAEYDALVEMLADAGVTSKIHGILVQVRFDGDRYFISDDQFALYGEGPTLEAARQDYWLAVQDYLADLETDAGQLARLRAILTDERSSGKGDLA